MSSEERLRSSDDPSSKYEHDYWPVAADTPLMPKRAVRTLGMMNMDASFIGF